MDNGVLESFDSLWFFSNILSPSPVVVGHDGNSSSTSSLEKFQDRHVQSAASSQVLLLENRSEEKKRSAPVPVPEITSTTEASRISLMARRRRKKRSAEETRRRSSREESFEEHVSEDGVIGIKDLGFAFNPVGCDAGPIKLESRVQVLLKTCCGLPEFGRSSRNGCGMPPFADDLAMKEHIRSWARTVAYVVR